MQVEKYLTGKPTRREYKAGVVVNTIQTTLDYLALSLEGKEIPIPRTTLAIFNGIASVFPEETRKERGDKILKLGLFSPVLIALNEAADIGVSADLRLKKGSLPPWKVWALIMLRNRAFQDLERRKQDFLRLHSKERETVGHFIEDFIFLSEHRGDFSPENYPDFLELDSGMFTGMCLHLVLPHITRSARIDLSKQVNNLEDLKKKYSLFLLRNPKDKNFSPNEEKIRSLQALEMILKIRDDANDAGKYKIDSILDIPNFWKYAEAVNPQNPGSLLRKMHQTYSSIAKQEFSQFVQSFTRSLLSVTSLLKARRNMKAVSIANDPANFWAFFGREKQSTTLRHEMNASTILTELFR